jgi:hypothetical protein
VSAALGVLLPTGTDVVWFASTTSATTVCLLADSTADTGAQGDVIAAAVCYHTTITEVTVIITAETAASQCLHQRLSASAKAVTCNCPVDEILLTNSVQQ